MEKQKKKLKWSKASKTRMGNASVDGKSKMDNMRIDKERNEKVKFNRASNEICKICENNKNRQKGITLIALVISIIVMLVLAGVSLNMTVGENGIVTKAQEAALISKFSQYMGEFEMNKVGAMIESDIFEDFIVNIKGTDSEFLKYVPSIKEEEREDYEIIGGYLIYKGKDEASRKAALSVGMRDEYDQAIYDTIGKEFAYYVESFYNAVEDGSISEAQYNAWKTKDTLSMIFFR